MLRSKWVRTIVIAIALFVAIGLLFDGFDRREAPLTDHELRAIQDLVGIEFPKRTSRVQVWFSHDGGWYWLQMRVDLDASDADLLVGRSWLGDHQMDFGEAGDFYPAAVPAPVRERHLWDPNEGHGHRRYYLRNTSRPGEDPINHDQKCLLRVGESSATLFFFGKGPERDLGPELMTALAQHNYEHGLLGFLPAQDPICGRQWP